MAGTSINIVHPRRPSLQKDIYKADCAEICEIETFSIETKKWSAKNDQLEIKIKELISLHEQGFIPRTGPLKKHQILYSVEASDDGKKVDITLGYPKSYAGTEFSKYATLIHLVEEIKRMMKFEIGEK